MSRGIGKHYKLIEHEKEDSAQRRNLDDQRPLSDRAVVLEAFADLARLGFGAFDETEVLGAQFFKLRTGERFWLGANEITRIE